MPGISIAHFIAFVLLSALVIVIPGPSVLFIVSRAVSHGRRVAMLSVLGNTAGEYCQVALVAFGVGALVEQSLELYTVLRLFGGGYLIYLGVRTYLARRDFRASLADLGGGRRSGSRTFFEAFTVGATNPKTIVFLASILTQFVNVFAGHVPAQILLLGAVFSIIAIISDTAWALAAGGLRTWFARSPKRLQVIGGAGGIAIAALGVGLIATGRRP